jgi:hypothetical protein
MRSPTTLGGRRWAVFSADLHVRIGLGGDAREAGAFCPSLLVARNDHERTKHETKAHAKRDCK